MTREAERTAVPNGPDQQVRFERLAADLAANFVNLPPDLVDPEIEEALGRICECLEMQLATVLTWTDPSKSSLIVTHEWSEQAGPPNFRGTVLSEVFPWLGKRLAEGEPLLITELEDFPPEARAERQAAEDAGLRSIAWVPFRTKQGLEGHVAINTLRRKQDWSEQDVDRLRLGGQIIANAIERRRADLRLQKAYAELDALKERLVGENLSLRATTKQAFEDSQLVGRSHPLQRVLHQVEQVASTDSTVLILGETGTGKELVARAIHAGSPRRDGPFVTVNCAALPEPLLESELFGHEKGAYTGALNQKLGRFEIANNGTIFLDEIGELPTYIQVKLLRFLQERQFERLGSTQTQTVDSRVVAATNRDLESMVEEGSFRSDLYFRLGVFPINVPPLRDRHGDIPLLVWFFIGELQSRLGKRIETVSETEMRALEDYPWPGNVRELQNVIERAMILGSGSSLAVANLLPNRRPGQIASVAARSRAGERLADVERDHMLAVLEECGWRIRGEGGAAERLGLKRTTLQSRMKKLGIERPSRGALPTPP